MREPPNNPKSLEKVFIESYDKYSANIYRHIYFRVNNKSVAEDITSETFFKTWEYLREGNEVKNLKSFLYKVAKNLIIDHYRRKPQEAIALEAIEERIEERESGGEIRIDVQVKIESINNLLKELPKDHQEIIIYRYLDDLSISEIKELTGKTRTNIYVIIHRALNFLKKNVQNE